MRGHDQRGPGRRQRPGAGSFVHTPAVTGRPPFPSPPMAADPKAARAPRSALDTSSPRRRARPLLCLLGGASGLMSPSSSSVRRAGAVPLKFRRELAGHDRGEFSCAGRPYLRRGRKLLFSVAAARANIHDPPPLAAHLNIHVFFPSFPRECASCGRFAFQSQLFLDQKRGV